jgi:hypothetical protein
MSQKNPKAGQRAGQVPQHAKIIKEHADKLGVAPTHLLRIAGFTAASWTYWQKGRDIKLGTLNQILAITAEDIAKARARKKR